MIGDDMLSLVCNCTRIVVWMCSDSIAKDYQREGADTVVKVQMSWR